MAQLKLEMFQELIKQSFNPEIEKAFEANHAAFSKLKKGKTPIKSNGFRIPLNRIDLHPWESDLEANLLMLRGEIDFPREHYVERFMKKTSFKGVREYTCPNCKQAAKQREEYQKILLEEKQ